MPEHQGLPVAGYKSQSEANVAAVNHNKQLEEQVLRTLDQLGVTPGVDPRWLAIGRTAIENGFMAVNRAIFKPGRVSLETDTPAASEKTTAQEATELLGKRHD
jgi:hypothetical protein